MRLFVLALALSSSATASSVPTAAAPIFAQPDTPEPVVRTERAENQGVINPNGPFSSACPATSRYEAARRGGRLPPSLLTQLPAADMYNAVYRRVDGCEVPMVVRYEVGGRR